MSTVAVILAGGIGKRLFPLSTPEHPKYLLELDGKTLLRRTFERILAVSRFAKHSADSLTASLSSDSSVGDGARGIIVATASAHVADVARELPELCDADGVSSERIIGEVEPRNTLPAVALAVEGLEDDDIVSVFPADHIIEPVEGLAKALETVRAAATEGKLAPIVLKAEELNPELGYITAEGKFLEKPKLELLEQLRRQGELLSNSGIYTFKVSEFRKWCTQFHGTTSAEQLPAVSFDKGISELLEPAQIQRVVGNFEFLDIGTLEVFEKVASSSSK